MYALRRIALAATLATAVPRTAHAEDLAVAAGFAEALSVPATAHLGAYPFAALALVVPAGRFAIVPSVGAEYAPDTGHWGFLGTVVVDTPVSPVVGFDVILSLAHDQPGAHWDEAAFAAGGGLGLSITTTPAVFSPSVLFYADIASGALSVSPGFSVARVF